MKNEMFEELLESVKEAKAIKKLRKSINIEGLKDFLL